MIRGLMLCNFAKESFMRLTHTAFTATFPTFFLGLAAAFQITALYVYHGHKPDWLLTTLCFVITTGTYLLNRIFDKEDKINNVSRWNFSILR
jgi:4-hydroxybenzoate polyprenyltransferase